MSQIVSNLNTITLSLLDLLGTLFEMNKLGYQDFYAILLYNSFLNWRGNVILLVKIIDHRELQYNPKPKSFL